MSVKLFSVLILLNYKKFFCIRFGSGRQYNIADMDIGNSNIS